MGYLAKKLGMYIAFSEAAQFLEKTTADNINSPFSELRWSQKDASVRDVESGEPSDGTEKPEDERDTDVPAPLFDEATLKAVRNYV